MQNLTIRGREFIATPTGNARMPYTVQNANGRGAVYGTFAGFDGPAGSERIYRLIGGRQAINVLRLDGNEVYVTDAAGDLREWRR